MLKQFIYLCVVRALIIFNFFSKRPRRLRSFLIPAYTGLGNFILKTPFIRELKRQFPDARIDILAGNSFGTEAVLKGSPYINETIIFPMKAGFREQFRFYWNLRKREYDAIFLPFDTSHVRHLYYGALLAGIGKRIGHFHSSFHFQKWVVSSINEKVEWRVGKVTEADLNFDLLESLVGPFERNYVQLMSCAASLRDEINKKMTAYLAGKGDYIVFQVSAANGAPTPKVWPKANFQKLLSMIVPLKTKIVALGDSGERKIAEEIFAPFGEDVLNLVGETQVNEVALIIKNARGLLCHDSGLMHIGSAVGTPLIALYGPGDFVTTRPVAKTSVVMKLDMPCMPCIGASGRWTEPEAVQKCPYQVKCMRDLSADDVYAKFIELGF